MARLIRLGGGEVFKKAARQIFPKTLAPPASDPVTGIARGIALAEQIGKSEAANLALEGLEQAGSALWKAGKWAFGGDDEAAMRAAAQARATGQGQTPITKVKSSEDPHVGEPEDTALSIIAGAKDIGVTPKTVQEGSRAKQRGVLRAAKDAVSFMRDVHAQGQAEDERQRQLQRQIEDAVGGGREPQGRPGYYWEPYSKSWLPALPAVEGGMTVLRPSHYQKQPYFDPAPASEEEARWRALQRVYPELQPAVAAPAAQQRRLPSMDPQAIVPESGLASGAYGPGEGADVRKRLVEKQKISKEVLETTLKKIEQEQGLTPEAAKHKFWSSLSPKEAYDIQRLTGMISKYGEFEEFERESDIPRGSSRFAPQAADERVSPEELQRYQADVDEEVAREQAERDAMRVDLTGSLYNQEEAMQRSDALLAKVEAMQPGLWDPISQASRARFDPLTEKRALEAKLGQETITPEEQQRLINIAEQEQAGGKPIEDLVADTVGRINASRTEEELDGALRHYNRLWAGQGPVDPRVEEAIKRQSEQIRRGVAGERAPGPAQEATPRDTKVPLALRMAGMTPEESRQAGVAMGTDLARVLISEAGKQLPKDAKPAVKAIEAAGLTTDMDPGTMISQLGGLFKQFGIAQPGAPGSQVSVKIPEEPTFVDLVKAARLSRTPADIGAVFDNFKNATDIRPRTIFERFNKNHERRALKTLLSAFPKQRQRNPILEAAKLASAFKAFTSAQTAMLEAPEKQRGRVARRLGTEARTVATQMATDRKASDANIDRLAKVGKVLNQAGAFLKKAREKIPQSNSSWVRLSRLQQSQAKDAFRVQMTGLTSAKGDLKSRDDKIKGLLEKERKDLAEWNTQKNLVGQLESALEEANPGEEAAIRNKLSIAKAKSHKSVKTAIGKTIARLTSAQNTIAGEVTHLNKRVIAAQLLWHKRTKTPVPEDLKKAAKDAKLWTSQREVRGR